VDQRNGCDLYRVTKTEDASEVRSNETIFNKKAVYGIKIENMDIDFRHEEVSVTPIMQVVLGLDKPLKERVIISGQNRNFKTLVNQLNKSLTVFETVCISSDNRLIYATQRATNK
jgi:hypothetical protein